jgi:hypothetical protein
MHSTLLLGLSGNVLLNQSITGYDPDSDTGPADRLQINQSIFGLSKSICALS